MSECDLMRESMPLLLTESLDPVRRELTHQHIERCPSCGREWTGYREAWRMLGELPELEVPASVKGRFLANVGELPERPKVVPLQRRPAARWLAQAAAVVLIAGGSYWFGHRAMPLQIAPSPATVSAPYSIAESRVLPASAISPEIQGRPDIQNVSFDDPNPNDDDIGLSFDITSHVTVKGRPTDKSVVRLLRYVLESEARTSPSRSRTIDWVRTTYSRPGNANPEIADALATVLRKDTHEGVRIKAVEALDRLARSGATLNAAAVDTLRQKAVQNDENVYVRVKAAEALSNIHQ